MRSTKGRRKFQQVALLRSQNHLNYYTFLYETDELQAVRAAMQRHLLYGWTRPPFRRKSSSDISTGASRSNLPTDEPASEASTTRTNRSRDISDNSQSRPGTSHATASSHDIRSISFEPELAPIFVTLDIGTPPRKKSFFRFLRRKSISLESFFAKSSQSQSEKKCNKKEENKLKQKSSPLINKFKHLFANIRNSDRFRWLSTRVVSTSHVDLVTQANQGTQENTQPTGEHSHIKRQLLSPERRRTATKLAELKSAQPVKYANGKNRSSSIRQTRRRSLSTREPSTRLTNTTTNQNSIRRSQSNNTPPSPTPHDPVHDQAAQNFFVINDESPASGVTSNSKQLGKAYLKEKPKKLNRQCATTTQYNDRAVSKGYNIKAVSIDTINTHHIVRFESPQPSASEDNYRETYERINIHRERKLSFETNTYNHELVDTQYYKKTSKESIQDIGREESIDLELQALGISPVEQLQTSPSEQQYTLEYIYEPQPGTSREYPRDRLVGKKIKKEFVNTQSVIEDYNPRRVIIQEHRSPVPQRQREPTPQLSDLAQSSDEYSRLHQPRSTDDKLRPKQLKGVLKPSNTFWRSNRYDIRKALDSPPDTASLNSDYIIINELLAESERLSSLSTTETQEYYQRPTLNSEYPEARDYGYQRQKHLRDYSDTRYLERSQSSPPENRDNSKTRRLSKKYYRVGMCSLEEHERKVIIEFCHLLEKSKQLFNGLRELPQYGHKQWHSYFGRTFDVYTKLWKFQQQHRAVLNTKYGLKRWQIGEIASKIGQLYYHFYLRTSEIAYLYEAYSFYYAIRGRSYYTKASKEDKCELMVKKLRYYARFIVVCLLLKKIKLVRDLIKELDRQIIEYGKTYDPDDQVEWTVVVDEVKAFVQAEPIVVVIDPDNYPVIVPQRLNIQCTPPVERSPAMTLSLQDVIIVGSSSHQVKFSELTMDMFRMLQTLEREPNSDTQHMYDESPRQRFNLTPTALNNKGYNLEPGVPHSDNPHKYLLFKPTTNQILVYLASSINDLPPNGVLLVYMSAEGQIGTPSKHIEDGYDIGGLITTSKSDVHREVNKEQKGGQSKYRDVNSFHPGDLFPYTRRPLFVIIDSDNSYVFQSMPRHFGQPLVILMSPLELPPSLNVSTSDRRQHGNLFTLFLHSPLKAFCHCCDIHTLSLSTWEKAISLIDSFMAEASLTVTRSRIDSQYISFMGDDFLRVLTLRYIFCEVVLRAHRAFRTRAQLPRSSPAIPDDVLEHPTLMRIIQDLAALLQVRPHFQESPSGTSSQHKE